MTERANTMKTYILRDPQTVEPQKPRFANAPDPQTAARTEKIMRAGSGPVLFLGLDVHNDTIAVSLAPSDRPEVRRYGIIGRGIKPGFGFGIPLRFIPLQSRWGERPPRVGPSGDSPHQRAARAGRRLGRKRKPQRSGGRFAKCDRLCLVAAGVGLPSEARRAKEGLVQQRIASTLLRYAQSVKATMLGG
jgi:hypothetical protein